MGLLAGKRPSNLGVSNGQLAALPAKPNCVSSQTKDVKKHVEPQAFSCPPADVITAAASVISSTQGMSIIEQTADYIYAECATPTLGFVDDLELWVDSDANLLHFRSASRLGYSDWGVNRKRVQGLIAQLNLA